MCNVFFKWFELSSLWVFDKARLTGSPETDIRKSPIEYGPPFNEMRGNQLESLLSFVSRQLFRACARACYPGLPLWALCNSNATPFMQQKISQNKPTADSSTANAGSIDAKNLASPSDTSKSALQAASAENPKPDEIARHMKQLLERFQDRQIQLGRDFHELSQNLSGVAFLADVIARDLMKEQAPSAHRLKEIGALIRKGIDDLRHLLTESAPNIIDRHGLASALRDLAVRMSRKGKQCSFEMPIETVVSNHNVAILLLELAELAVTFVTDRGRGNTTHIVLQKEDAIVTLRIENDGICEDPSVNLPEDLLMMRSFISVLEGSLAVGSDGASGTFVIAVIPEGNCES